MLHVENDNQLIDEIGLRVTTLTADIQARNYSPPPRVNRRNAASVSPF